MYIFVKSRKHLLCQSNSFHLLLIGKGFSFANRMHFHVLLKVLFPGQGFTTNRTGCFDLAFAMQSLVPVQVVHSWKSLVTHFTLVWLQTHVHVHMSCQACLAAKVFSTDIAGKSLFQVDNFNVLVVAIAHRKSFLTMGTLDPSMVLHAVCNQHLSFVEALSAVKTVISILANMLLFVVD